MSLNKQKTSLLIPLVVSALLFSGFVFMFEYYTARIADRQIREHARIIGDDLWNFNRAGVSEYLKLAVRAGHYERLSVVKSNGRLFEEVYGDGLSTWETVGFRLGLVHRISLVAPVEYGSNYIGWLEAVLVPWTLPIYLLVFSFLSLLTVNFLLYQRVLKQRDILEQSVRKRTEDLYQEKIKVEEVNRSLKIVSAEFQALLDNSPVGILFVGFDRHIKRINQEISRITGYSNEELVGKSTETLYESREIYKELGRKNYPILHREGFLQADTEIIRKDGSRVMCNWRGQVLPGVDGVDGVVWILEDISVRLKMEEELLKVKKLESIGVLAGGLAHDFNNLLFAILGNISLAAKLTTEDEKVQDLLSTAEKASLRAKDLTVKLLTFASGGEPVKVSESLPQLLKESASFVLSGSNVKCVYDFPDDLWSAKMDKGQISQVIQNLILNADQAMGDGGIVTLSCANIDDGSVIPGLESRPYVQVTVSDTGAGISRKDMEKIFDPYFSTKQKDSNKGSGLGLSIVHSIISKHDGLITVDSEPGNGAVFTIYLPATFKKPHYPGELEEIIVTGKGRVLVMDDDQVICQVASELLNYLGYETEKVNDGREAVDRYTASLRQGKKFDAVIMDLTIPGGMGGEEAIRHLLAVDPDVRAIVSSGYAQRAILDNYRDFGFCANVSKPYQLHELSAVIKEVIGNG